MRATEHLTEFSTPSVEFIHAHARPLDQALFAFWFENGGTAAVEVALAAYQNPDGGFGRCLEPDFRLQDSSVLATTMALQVLVAVDAPASSPLVQGAMRYLAATFDADRLSWTKVPPAIASVPRAPWWQYAGDEPGFEANPSAEALGYCYRYAELVPAELIERAEQAALAALAAQHEIEWHELLCWMRLVELAPARVREAVEPRIREAIASTVCLDPAQWGGYVPRPLSFVTSPNSPFFDLVASAMDADLDSLITQRLPDGGWEPAWAWGQYEDVWPTAKQEWRGHLTVKNLKTLQDFDRLAR